MTADPGPGPKPSGPTHPTPTGPPSPGRGAVAALVADIERQLSAPLHLLVAAVLDGDYDPAQRSDLNAAAQHVSLALSRLAHIESPARQVSTPSAGPEGAPGGPVKLDGFRLPRDVRGPQIGEGALYDALPLPACGAPTPDGPCDLAAGHPVGPWWPGFSGHMPARQSTSP